MGASHGLFSPVAVPGSAGAAALRQNVYQAIAAWAVRQRAGRLNAWLVLGVMAAAEIWVFLPVAWPLACAFVCLAAIGGWGMAAQQVLALDAAGTPSPRAGGLLRELKFAAVVAGTLAAILAFFGVFLFLLGPSWKL